MKPLFKWTTCYRALFCALVFCPLKLAATELPTNDAGQAYADSPANPYEQRRQTLRSQKQQALISDADADAPATPPPSNFAAPNLGAVPQGTPDAAWTEENGMRVYHSPEAVIKREIIHLTPPEQRAQLAPKPIIPNLTPEQLAAMMPAAGGDAPGVNTPLIQTPSDHAATPAPADTTKTLSEVKPLLGATSPATASGAPVNMLLQTLTAPPPPGISEPSASLAPESKALLTKLPPTLEEKKKQSKELDINHAKEANKPLGGGEATVKNNPMGMKIEMKTPAFDANYQLEKAYNALSSGHTPEAIQMYQAVLDNDPNNKNALFGLATAYHRVGQLEKARPLYSKLLSIDPNNRDGLNNFLVLMADEAPEEALVQLNQLEAKNPQFSPIPAQMAVIYQKLGDYDKASEKMFRAIELSPENITYRYNLAIMLDKQKKYDEAAKLYHQVLEAYMRGETIPGDAQKIQQRLIFISSNRG